MKYLLFTIALFLCVNITAQELPKKSKIFVRVYNNEGQKIAKGKILKITDSTLVLKKGSRSITVPSSEISNIKTKRTKGHSVLMGALPGAALLIISNDGYAAASASGGVTPYSYFWSNGSTMPFISVCMSFIFHNLIQSNY